MGKEDKKEPFLVNLGRATLRGLRKCKKCGTMNGTRGFSCKNKTCDVIFKESGSTGYKKKSSTEPFKIVTGNNAQIYSVRVRDKGPDYRAFVQLPNLTEEVKMMMADTCSTDPAALFNAGAKCYVESCAKINSYGINSPSLCSHLKSVIHCFKSTQPLIFGNSVLNAYQISNELKKEIYELAIGSTGPLVQRVSKQLFIVKCIPDSIHPLGFLHCTFSLTTQSKRKSDYKFFCSCRNFKSHFSREPLRKCIHLYACGLVFSSDDMLSDEFSYYLDFIQNKLSRESLKEENPLHLLEDSDDEVVMEDIDERSFLILNDASSGAPCQVEVQVVKDEDIIKQFSHTDVRRSQDNLEIQLQSEDGLHLRTSDGGTISVHQLPENVSLPSLKRKQDDVVQASSALLSLQKSTTGKKLDDCHPPPKKFLSKKPPEEDCYALTFHAWLASVVERINQTMHYGFSGKPDPLVFHLPKIFFEPLLDRIHRCLRTKKGKMLEETQKFERREAVPLGEFTKHTWRLTSLSQVQKVLSNPSIILDVTKTFVQESDGSYRVSDQDLQMLRMTELKTVLRVGGQPPRETPFTIEWIPDILPQTQIGELRLRFEFDHYCNGHLVCQKPFILSPANAASKAVLKGSQPPIAPRPPPNHKFLAVPPNNENVLTFPTESINSGESITLLTF